MHGHIHWNVACLHMVLMTYSSEILSIASTQQRGSDFIFKCNAVGAAPVLDSSSAYRFYCRTMFTVELPTAKPWWYVQKLVPERLPHNATTRNSTSHYRPS